MVWPEAPSAPEETSPPYEPPRTRMRAPGRPAERALPIDFHGEEREPEPESSPRARRSTPCRWTRGAGGRRGLDGGRGHGQRGEGRGQGGASAETAMKLCMEGHARCRRASLPAPRLFRPNVERTSRRARTRVQRASRASRQAGPGSTRGPVTRARSPRPGGSALVTSPAPCASSTPSASSTSSEAPSARSSPSPRSSRAGTWTSGRHPPRGRWHGPSRARARRDGLPHAGAAGTQAPARARHRARRALVAGPPGRCRPRAPAQRLQSPWPAGERSGRVASWWRGCAQRPRRRRGWPLRGWNGARVLFSDAGPVPGLGVPGGRGRREL